MKWSKVLKFVLAVTAAGAVLHAQGAFAADAAAKQAPVKTEAKAPAKGKEATTKATERVVKLEVTDNGFEPSPIQLKKDEPVALMVTRKTDKTCATEIVMKDYNIMQDLPLDQEVAIRFTPTKTGTLKYGCAMGQMISGQFVVE